MNHQPPASGSKAMTAAAFATVYLVWGSTYLAIRLGLESMPPLLMAGSRFLVAGAILHAWARARGADRPEPGHWKGAAVAGLLLIVAGNGGVTWAEQAVPSGLTALLVASEPIWLVLLSWACFGGERPGRRVVAGLALGMVGVGLLVVPSGELDGASTAGVVAILLSAIAWAAGSLSLRGASLPKSPALTTGMQMLVGGAVLVALGLARGEARAVHPDAISGASALAWLYLVAFGSIAAFSAYTYLLRVATPAHVSTYAYVNPVVAVALGRLVLDEPIAPAAWLAAAVILASVALVTAPGAARPEAAPMPKGPESLATPAYAGAEAGRWAGSRSG